MAVTELDQKLILVAEDDDEIRGLIKQALESENEGLNLLVVEAKDGAEAIAQAEKQEFQCVITDLKMPLASGEDLIRSLQSKAANAHTPTLVVSGHMDADFGEQYKNVRTISKPFLPNDLAKAVVREVKLGRTDERAPVHLINPFVAAVRKLMTEDLKLHTDLQAPKVKKSGDPVDGEVHCTMTMTTGPMQFRFTLSFDELW